MKVATTGKGGVGMTTLPALSSRVARTRGNRVIAIDADPCLDVRLGNLADGVSFSSTRPSPGGVEDVFRRLEGIAEATAPRLTAAHGAGP